MDLKTNSRSKMESPGCLSTNIDAQSVSQCVRRQLSESSCATFAPINITKEEVAQFMDQMRSLEFTHL